MQKKIVSAGHICVDITPVFPVRQMALKDVFVPGRIVHTDGVKVNTGGSVANTGLAMKILGADVKLMGKIGADEFGKMILKILEQYGYDGGKDMIITGEAGTSYTIALAVPGNDRIFLHDPGANDAFCYEDLDFEAISQASLFHFGYPSLMKRMYQQDGAELIRIFRQVKAMGLATSLDMAAVDAASEAGKADWKKIIRGVLPYVDFFVPSVEEICYMLDPDRYDSWAGRAEGRDMTLFLDVEKDIKPLADELMDMGAKALLIKCGAPGLYYRTAGEEILAKIGPKAELDIKAWAGQEGFERSYRPEYVRSGTGAGDTCIAAFLTAMMEGRKLQDCIRLAAATGACCVETYDSLSGLKPFEELEKKIAGGWEKV